MGELKNDDIEKYVTKINGCVCRLCDQIFRNKNICLEHIKNRHYLDIMSMRGRKIK